MSLYSIIVKLKFAHYVEHLSQIQAGWHGTCSPTIIDNVKFPFYMELPAQKLEFSTTSLELNKDLKDSSF